MLRKRQDEILDEARKVLYKHGYFLGNPIGDGGFATVYRVKSRQYDEDFAVKLIDLSVADDEPLISFPEDGVNHKITNNISQLNSALPSSFEAEINALTNLCHPNVIKIYNHFRSDTLMYIILEYCPGGCIKDLMEKSGYIKPPQLYELCKEILSALDCCHRNGIAHRDVKPSNILIDKYGRAKLADFGLAQKSQLSKMFGGSLPYLAPEILKKKPFDPIKADVWALGVTFFELAAGYLPFKADSIEQLKSEIGSNSLAIPPHFTHNFTGVLKLMLNAQPHHRSSVQAVSQLPIFSSQKTEMNRTYSNSINPTEKQRMKMGHISSSAYLARNTSSRKSLLFTKKRFFSLPINKTFAVDQEMSDGELETILSCRNY
ncbi:CAMK family protein kinase [Tritrichomonas foetus]|uniref:CAMK family protein kinase n=1 Tax=Tritrichomonas foetus TaxID=1144522 RepID=A0A1J4JB89_9EUKA|nr:CAMK family protein kinase [Tritrichomonas foetus]|eukprot:OHS96458.1 CAMK family protein kinase [Tritrichomonas foetus]